MEEEAARGGAALTGGADGGEDHGAEREVKVGVLVDDDGVVAAELEEAAAQAAGDGFADDAAHAARAGGGDERDAPVGDEALADLVVGAHDHAEDAGVAHAFGDAFGDALGGDGDERGEEAGLPDRDVAADGGEHGVPAPDGVGEVEGGDDADGPEGEPLLEHAVVGAFAGEDLAGELAGEADGEVGDIDGLLDLAEPFGADLAHFEREELAEGFLQGAELIADSADEVPPDGRGDHAPGFERFERLGDDGVGAGRVVEAGAAEDFTRGGRAADDGTGVGGRVGGRVGDEAGIVGYAEGFEEVAGHVMSV